MKTTILEIHLEVTDSGQPTYATCVQALEGMAAYFEAMQAGAAYHLIATFARVAMVVLTAASKLRQLGVPEHEALERAMRDLDLQLHGPTPTQGGAKC